MNGYLTNIEKDTKENTDYRRVLYTGKNSQLVLMNINAGDEIGEEVHTLDQFLRFEEGEGVVILDGVNHKIKAEMAVVVPAGTIHNVINTGITSLKLYTIYSPPEHKDKTIHHTKQDEKEEHFDGRTTEQ